MWLSSNHVSIDDDSVLSVNLNQYSLGYGNNPVYEILNMENLLVSIDDSDTIAIVSPVNVGLGSFSYRVTDAEGSSKVITVNVAIHKHEEVEEEVTVLEVGSKSVTIIYPNPVADLVRLESDGPIESYEVFDASGKQFLTKQNLNTAQVEIDMSSLTPGIYFLKVVGKDQTETLKIVK